MSDAREPCIRWGHLGHNWIIVRGWFGRRWRYCCACDAKERVR